ncbi:response regulator [Legionella sp. D16C41]|uniref:response regulator n=1 Tax=Legionella sp. D16C41 TaxID=3402688 RepID=UPI003AF6FE45
MNQRLGFMTKNYRSTYSFSKTIYNNKIYLSEKKPINHSIKNSSSKSTANNIDNFNEKVILKPPHLLLIEDNHIALRLAEIIINKTGCQLTSATNKKQALELINTIKFDLIFIDITSPDLAGTKISKQIRNLQYSQQSKNIPIIGLTSHESAKEQETCFQAGINEVLLKPLSLKTIQSILTKFLPTTNDITQGLSPLSYQELSQQEHHLFDLTAFSILDPLAGINNTGSEVLFRDLLTMFLEEELPEEETLIQKAYENNNWSQVTALAHKMRSSAIYCGAIKLHVACKYIENYLKSDNSKLTNKLCIQLFEVIKETKLAIDNYLSY